MTCAPPAPLLPVGCSASSAAVVTSGSLLSCANRIGAWIGLPTRTEAAIPVRQSPTSARITAAGRDSGVRAGYVASAAPAASATASAPGTRVVFLVATTGNPSGGPAGFSSPFCEITGALGVGVPVPPPPPQPASARATNPKTAGRSTITDHSGARSTSGYAPGFQTPRKRAAPGPPMKREVAPIPRMGALNWKRTAASYRLPHQAELPVGRRGTGDPRSWG